MCNFYVMYYVDGDHALSNSFCFTDGPPNWYWDDLGLEAAVAPLTASIVPGSEDFIAATDPVVIERQREFFDSENLAELLESMTAGDEAENELPETEDSNFDEDEGEQLARELMMEERYGAGYGERP